MCDWLVLDCVMQCHPGTSVAAVHHEITNYLKMAPYRQGGAGKGASLAEDDVASPDEADNDNNWLLTAILIALLYLVLCHQAKGLTVAYCVKWNIKPYCVVWSLLMRISTDSICNDLEMLRMMFWFDLVNFVLLLWLDIMKHRMSLVSSDSLAFVVNRWHKPYCTNYTVGFWSA